MPLLPPAVTLNLLFRSVCNWYEDEIKSSYLITVNTFPSYTLICTFVYGIYAIGWFIVELHLSIVHVAVDEMSQI